MNFKSIYIIALVLAPMAGCAQAPETATDDMSETKKENPYYSRTDKTKLDLTDEVWQSVLSEDVYYVSRQKGTERAFTGKYWDHEGLGDYFCGACGNHLFVSDSKFASQCGWPSFFEAVDESSVEYIRDATHGMIRTEVVCGRCEGHLGHIFDDGPAPTHKRFCMNSAVLDFEPIH